MTVGSNILSAPHDIAITFLLWSRAPIIGEILFALFYNVAMITLATNGGFDLHGAHVHFGPVQGAIAHQASSIIVILNSMRLLRKN